VEEDSVSVPSPSPYLVSHIIQGYEDNGGDEDDDDEEDGSYADEEYGKKKVPKKKKVPPASSRPKRPSPSSSPAPHLLTHPKQPLPPVTPSQIPTPSMALAPKRRKKPARPVTKSAFPAVAEKSPITSMTSKISGNSTTTKWRTVDIMLIPMCNTRRKTKSKLCFAIRGTKGGKMIRRMSLPITSCVLALHSAPFLRLIVLQRFHIKWKNFSHLHNTDETYEFLKRFKGLKRVDNYIKNFKFYQTRLATPGLSREDAEAIMLDKEREKEEWETNKIIERIIAHRDGENTTEYFCKWTNLYYEHCTWETQDEIRPIGKEVIEAYRQREAEAKFPYKSVVYPKGQRPKFVKIEKDPEYVQATGGELKDFQLTGLNWLAYVWSKGENGILADEMGLGKVKSSFYLF
jgi:chromodomain-helicase-DNA-binding protein 1